MTAKRHKLTPEEVQEVLSKPFDIFPEPSPEAKRKGIVKRGPSAWQRPLMMWEYPFEERINHKDNMHIHTTDMALAYGGRGGGKTQIGVSLNLFFMIMFPGCRTLCGADVFNDVEKFVWPKFKQLLSVRSDWDHPYVKHVPNKQDKYLSLEIPVFNKETGKVDYKTSICDFMHFSEWQRLRGNEYSYAHMEEISQLADEITANEIERSLRSPLTPFRMMYAATNPPESMSHWLYNKWDLTSYMPDFDGEKPKPVVCTCQFCQECINDKENPGEYPYDEKGVCTNPNCSFLKFCATYGIPPKRYQKPSYVLDNIGHKSIRNKHIECPGNEPYYRVVHSTALDNPHLPADLMQNLKGGQDEANFAVFAMGEVRALRSNKVFPSYAYDLNVNQQEVPVNVEKDIVWSHDHNIRPRCSVIAQEYVNSNEDFTVQVIDEIVMYDTKQQAAVPFKKRIKGVGPEHVAEEFIARYSKWNQAGIEAGNQKAVYLHGDHTALNNKMSPFARNEFQIIYDMLTDAGFKVIVCVIKIEGKTQINTADRIALTNWLLRDNNDNPRIKINKKKCPNLLKSLEDLERKPNEKEETDKACDELARKATNTNIVHLISHPAEALGYYLSRCFNLVKEDNAIKFIYIEGGNLLNIDTVTGKLSRVPRPNVYDQPKKMTKEELDKAYEKTYLDRIRGYVNESAGQAEDDIQNFLNYFG